MQWDALYDDHVKTLTKRLETVLTAAGKRGLVIPSGSPKVTFLDDHHYPFKVNPHFKAWLPVTSVPDSFLLLRSGERPVLLFNQPQDYWHKPPADPFGFWTGAWDIQVIRSPRDVHNLIGDPRELIFVGEETAQGNAFDIDAINPESVLNALHFDRAYKTDYELAVMRAAQLSAASGHLAAEQAFRRGLSEFEIQHAYLAATRSREQHAPYSAIVALNENCAVLHYQHYELDPPPVIHSMLIDAGADESGYAADVTRTYAWAPGEFQSLIDRMDTEQLGIIDDISPGMNYADLHQLMHLRLARVLADFGLVTMSPESMVDAGVTAAFLPHGLGHLLGLQTHDVAGFQQDHRGTVRPAPDRYPALRLTRPIEDRQVFTIEPGLYFIPMLLQELKSGPHRGDVNWDGIERLMPCGGIRIEDNVAMIDGRPVNMTRDAFRDVAA